MIKHRPLLLAGCLITLGISLAFSGWLPKAWAETLRSDSYIVQFGNFNMGSGIDNQGRVSFTMGQIAPGPYGDYDTSNYFLGAGFQYIYQLDQFQFTISDTNLDFGILTPNIHETVSNTLTITTTGAGGYTVYAYEQNPLELIDGSTQIPDATCDTAPTDPCSETEAKPWTTQTNPGFGFNIQGETVPDDFKSTDDDCSSDSECYRQFADNSASTAESMQPVMTSTSVGLEDTASVTYKAGVGVNQASGTYQTAIVYIAVPGY